MEGRLECDCRRGYVTLFEIIGAWLSDGDAGPAHAVYFGTYEVVKEFAGGNVDDGHHPLAAGECPAAYTHIAATDWI